MTKDFKVTISIGFNQDMTRNEVEQYFDQLIGEWADKVQSWGTQAEKERLSDDETHRRGTGGENG